MSTKEHFACVGRAKCIFLPSYALRKIASWSAAGCGGIAKLAA